MQKRIIGLSIIGLIFAVFMINIAAAQGFDPVKDLFTSWEEGGLSTNIAKYAFFVLITLLVFSLLEVVGVVPQYYIRWPIAIIIGFLATAYITPEEVMAMLTSYTALGILIGTFLPFTLLVLFTYAVTGKGAGGLIIQYFVWILFSVLLLYKSIFATVEGASVTLVWINWGATVAAVIFGLIFNKQMRGWFGRIRAESRKGAVERGRRKVVAGVETAAELGEAAERAGRAK